MASSLLFWLRMGRVQRSYPKILLGESRADQGHKFWVARGGKIGYKIYARGSRANPKEPTEKTEGLP